MESTVAVAEPEFRGNQRRAALRAYYFSKDESSSSRDGSCSSAH
jgi:hypothetical protein